MEFCRSLAQVFEVLGGGVIGAAAKVHAFNGRAKQHEVYVLQTGGGKASRLWNDDDPKRLRHCAHTPT